MTDFRFPGRKPFPAPKLCHSKQITIPKHPRNFDPSEPVMRLDMSVDPRYFEAVKIDLAARRGVVEDSSFEGSMRTLVALVPLSEMLGYSSAVRRISSGTVTFTAKLAEYREVAVEETRRIVSERR